MNKSGFLIFIYTMQFFPRLGQKVADGHSGWHRGQEGAYSQALATQNDQHLQDFKMPGMYVYVGRSNISTLSYNSSLWVVKREHLNKCSDRAHRSETSVRLGNYDKPTNQPTDRRTWGVIGNFQ